MVRVVLYKYNFTFPDIEDKLKDDKLSTEEKVSLVKKQSQVSR